MYIQHRLQGLPVSLQPIVTVKTQTYQVTVTGVTVTDAECFPFQSHPSHDKNCFFRTSFPGQKSLAMLDAVISKAHSNVTHSMSLAVYKPKHKRPIGERVQVGKEGRQHQVSHLI